MRRPLYVLTPVALLLLASCSVGPKYKVPSAPTAPAFKEQGGNDQWKTATPSDGEIRGNWWDLFSDPELSKLEQQVAVSNQTVKQAEAQFRQARALVAFNRAGYFPTITTSPGITTSYGGGRGIVSNGTVTGGSGGFNSNFTIPFGVSWEPDLWGRVRLSVEGAAANAQAAAADIENVRLSIQAELAADYFQLRGIDMDEKLLRDTLAAYQQALTLTINRYNGGVASRADVEQARTQLDNTQAALTDLGITRSQLEHAIAVLTGHPPADLNLPQGQIQGTPPPVPVGLPSQLLERRPDIARSERQVAAANAQIGLARTAYYPTLSLGISAGLQGSSVANLFSWPARFFSVGPNISETLFDFGRRRAQSQEAVAAYDVTVAAYRQTILGAFQEVEDNLAALHILAQESVEQAAAVASAQESLRLEIDRYKAGTVGYLDVITTQTIALNSQRAAVQILSRRMTSAVNLIRAVGGGWNSSTLPSPSDLRSGNKSDPVLPSTP